jgi:polyhydroxyalkanoate synthesis repressor PhaR
LAIFAGKEGESDKGAKKAQTPWGRPCGGQIRVNQGLSAWRLSLEWPIAADFLMALALQEFSLPTKPSAQSISPDPSAPTSATEGVRTIKKYPNRRLYDTTSSTYVTLAEIKKLIMRATPMVVLDAKTGEDLTRAILLQIILTCFSTSFSILAFFTRSLLLLLHTSCRPCRHLVQRVRTVVLVG